MPVIDSMDGVWEAPGELGFIRRVGFEDQPEEQSCEVGLIVRTINNTVQVNLY